MAKNNSKTKTEHKPIILLVDDEQKFREAMNKQLSVRGYEVLEVERGFDAIKVIRHKNPEVVILDQKMPGMDGIQTLQEIKRVCPEIQVIMLTGHGNIDAATTTGRHDVFRYMHKPCPLDELIENIEAAREERIHAMARNEVTKVEKGSLKKWLAGVHNARPGFMILGLILFTLIVTMPSPKRLVSLMTTPKSGQQGELIAGYAEYKNLDEGQTISDYYGTKAKLQDVTKDESGNKTKSVDPGKTVFRAKVMIGVLVVAALFWATGTIPIGMTALLVGVFMYFFGVLPPDYVAKAYAKDAVIFIFGVLAISGAVTKTGLDRRIGIILLGTSTSLKRFAFIFAPLLAVTASFLSEHALIAFIVPVLMISYMGIIKVAGVKQNKSLAIMMLLMVSYVANAGGPGSPAAGGRNAVMLGILADYGNAPSFAQWVQYGLPFVPVMALVTALYFFIAVGRKVKIDEINIAAQVKKESKKLGKMTKEEYLTAGVLVLLIGLWITMSSRFGMGGPVILALVLLNIMGIMRWRDVNKIHWDVVALYGSASAMGVGLASTGAALWIADGFITILPESMKSGIGLCVSSSLFTGVLTNFMSDGATVAAIGPITVPMAMLSGTHPWMVGLATAFASSFAHMMIIGTPNNAIVFSLAKDPETGEQLITMRDFLVHGGAVLILSFAVLWLWVFMGYWQWIGF